MDGNEFADILINKDRREYFMPGGEEEFYKQCSNKLRSLSTLVARQAIEIQNLKETLARVNSCLWIEITDCRILECGESYFLQHRTTGESVVSLFDGSSFYEETKGFAGYGLCNQMFDHITKNYKIFTIMKPPK
jgi:hypothetical protein